MSDDTPNTTPNDPPGDFHEDEVMLRDQAQYGQSTPSGEGGIIYSGGAFILRDNAGDYNPRSGGSGITEAQHEVLDTLVHEIDESSYDEVVYSGHRVQTYTVWASAAKLLKIREETYTYVGNTVSQAVTVQYDEMGTVKMTMTEVYTYSGSRVTSVTRTKS